MMKIDAIRFLLAVSLLFAKQMVDLPVWAAPPSPPQKTTAAPEEEAIMLPAISANIVVLSLPTIVQRVLDKNLDIQVSQSRIRQSQGEFVHSLAPLFPSIRGFYQLERLNGGEVIFGETPISLDRVTHRPTLAADYSIQIGGRTIYEIKAARQQLARARHANTQQTQKALLDTCIQYYTWLRDQAQERFYEQLATEAKSLVRFQESRYKVGFGTRLEVLQSQSLLAERGNDLLSVRNQQEVSGLALANFLNYPLSTVLSVEASETLVPTRFGSATETRTLEELYQLAEKNRADIKALLAKIAESQSRLGVVRSDFFPTVTFSGYMRKIGPDVSNLDNTTQGAVAVSMDLFRNMGVKTAGALRTATAEIQEARLNYARQLQEIRKQISQASLNTALYKNQLTVEQERLHATLEGYQVAKKRLKTGMGINLELIQAESELAKAQVGLYNTVMNYNVAQLQLLYETGQLSPEVILQAQVEPLPVSDSPVKSAINP